VPQRLSRVLRKHAFDIRINFKDRWMWGPIHPGGPSHGYTSVLSGVVEGPMLNGKVVDVSGADWPVVRSDGVVELAAHYMLEADDGSKIYIRNMGYVYARGLLLSAPGREPPARASRLLPLHEAYFRPREVPNEGLSIGGGRRRRRTRSRSRGRPSPFPLLGGGPGRGPGQTRCGPGGSWSRSPLPSSSPAPVARIHLSAVAAGVLDPRDGEPRVTEFGNGAGS
jgi:hypothetical protein